MTSSSKRSVLILTSAFTLLYAKKFPSDIQVCHQSEPDVQSCYLRAFQQVRDRFNTGIPEFSLPSMNLLILPIISLNSDNSFRASFSNVEIFHLSHVQIKDFEFNLENNYLKCDVVFPVLRIKSTYNIQGRILFLNLNSNGPADGNFTNVEVLMKLFGERYRRKGKEYLRFYSLKMEEKIHKPVFTFGGLFANNPELTEQTNKVINENIDEIIGELSPSVHDAVNQTVIGLISRLFSTYSIKELFPN